MDVGFLKLHDLHTRVLETCEWDEEVTASLIARGLQVYIDLYEYTQHDTSLIKGEEDFDRLFRVNMGEGLSQDQLSAIKELIDVRLKQSIKKQATI
tara:strand:+ start:489 stop:776 length:288 start_codon:yes stop_codon:yes gene_type:complete